MSFETLTSIIGLQFYTVEAYVLRGTEIHSIKFAVVPEKGQQLKVSQFVDLLFDNTQGNDVLLSVDLNGVISCKTTQ